MITLPNVYNQRDSRWHTEPLGTSSIDIGNAGCLVSVMAMLCTYYKHVETPSTLNRKLITAQGYTDGNLYEWYTGVPAIYKDITCTGLFSVPDPLNAGQEAIIDEELAAGRPVVVEVDFNPYTAAVDNHWVLVIGKQDGVYICADPWSGTIDPITKYGKQAITIQYFVTHEGSEVNSMSTMYTMPSGKQLDLSNQDSMKVACNIFDEVMNLNLWIKKADVEAQYVLKTELEACQTQLKEVQDWRRENEPKIIALQHDATEWDATKKAYKVNDFTELDTYIRNLQPKEPVSQTSEPKDEVIAKPEESKTNTNKESVKITEIPIAELINELLNRLVTKFKQH